MSNFDSARRQYHRDNLISVRNNFPVSWDDIHKEIMNMLTTNMLIKSAFWKLLDKDGIRKF